MIEKILNFIKEERRKSQEYRSKKLKESDYVKANVAHGEIQTLNKVEAFVQEVAKEYGNGWIPCSEQFPKKYAYVLVCDREGDIYIASMYENEIFGKVWRQWNGGELREDWVIAWQPLPAPFKKGEGE